MPSKAEFYRQMAEQVSTRLVGSWKEWTAFLTTAARLYKYPFHEQMMIYAQRPDATACAEYDLWNEKMGRYVRRGSKGIALVDDSGDRPRLRYVFDISDTGTREHSRTPWLWQLEEQHIGPVSAMLERNYLHKYPVISHWEASTPNKVGVLLLYIAVLRVGQCDQGQDRLYKDA